MVALGTSAWPVSRLLAVAGAVLGLALAAVLLVGAFAGLGPGVGGAGIAGFGVVGLVGGVHLLLGVLGLASGALLLRNPRLHGGLLALWGALGLFVGFGFWLGSVLLLVAGILGLARGVGPSPGGRRPVV